MADDQFTAQLEWLCRLRVESIAMSRLIRCVRKFLQAAGSSQTEGGLRVWVNPEVAQMYYDLERMLAVLDPDAARFLEGSVCMRGSYLPNGTVGAKPLDALSSPNAPSPSLEVVRKYGREYVVESQVDKRPIKGPGRRFMGHQ